MSLIARNSRTLLWWALGMLILGTVFARLIRLPYASTVQSEWETTVGEVWGTSEVGQLFESVRPYFSGVAFQIATYGGRENTAEVIVEIRESLTSPVLRTVRVSAVKFHDHQWYVFRFPRIVDSRGKTYYASLRSPDSRPGNAITVDYSNRNPYEKLGPSAMVVIRSERTPETVRRSVKTNADLAFTVRHDIPGTEYARVSLGRSVRNLRADPRRWRTEAAFLVSAALVTALALDIPRRVRFLTQPRVLPYFVGALFVSGLLFRLLFAFHLPATNDEGTALYDAWTLHQGRLPGGDGVLKAPVFVGVLSWVLTAVGPSVSNGRLASLLAGALTALPLMSLARRVGRSTDVRSRMSVLWLLSAAPALFAVYIHAQPLQILLLAIGLAVLAKSVDTDIPARRRWLPLLFGLAAGVLFGLALGTRKTTLAVALPALVLVLCSALSWRRRGLVLLACAGGVALVVGGLGALEYRLYGAPGVQYFLGVEHIKIDPETTATAEERRSALIKGVLPIFREAPVLIAFALVGLGATAERLFVRAAKWSRILRRSVWLLPILLATFGGNFLRTYERSEYLTFGLVPYWWALPPLLVLFALWPRRADNEEHPTPTRVLVQSFLVPVLWLVAVAVLYHSWIKFTANYLTEFLPALTLFAAFGVTWITNHLRSRRLAVALAGVLLFWGSYNAARAGYTFPHTGTFDLSSLTEAAAVVRGLVPPHEPILTAAVAIPVMTGHRVPFDVAHPTHYAYGYIEPKVRNIYMAPAERMVETVLHDVRWVVLEKLTAFSYFREYPQIERYVTEEFAVVKEIENLSNPITILRKRTP